MTTNQSAGASRASARPIQQRGRDTRQRLLEAAVDQFSELGFAGVSTRTIANVAGVSSVAIKYYFGSKRVLYLKALSRSGALLRRECRLILSQLRRRGIFDIQSREAQCDLLASTLTEFVCMLGKTSWMRLLFRASLDSVPGSERALVYIAAIVDLGTTIAFKMVNNPTVEAQLRLQATSLVSIIGFYFACQNGLRRHGLAGLWPECSFVNVVRGGIRNVLMLQTARTSADFCYSGTPGAPWITGEL